MPNTYSRNWFKFFHVAIDDERTTRETAFICSCAALPHFNKILDVCCGTGRHARALSSRGYSVTGVDRDSQAIVRARQLAGGPAYIKADIRDYQPACGAFDAAIVMGQSFGYFDAATNRELLGRLSAGIRKGGRLILDLWNPEFFADRQGQRELDTAHGIVRETKHVKDGRLLVHLDYPDGTEENFDWQLFTPDQLEAMARSISLKVLVHCADFDQTVRSSPANPRIQIVLQRDRA